MTAQTHWLRGGADTVSKTFDDALRARGPHAPFIDYAGRVYTLGEIDLQSTRLAHGLLARGVRPGQCVASLLDSCIEQVVLLLANARIGTVHAPINTAYKGEFLRHQLADCAAPIIVTNAEYAQRVLAIAAGLPQARTLLVQGELPPAAGALAVAALDDAYVDSNELLDFDARPSDLMLLIFTGGTTGPSKGCMISHQYVCALGAQIAGLNRLGPADVMWTPLPAFHFNQIANMWGALMCGARFAVYPKFSVSNFWPEIERTGATVCNLLASMVTMLADAPDNPAMQRCHGQLRIVGGVPFPKATQEIWRQRFGVKEILHSLFGLTECSPLATYPLHLPMPVGACGKANENFELMIVDADDNELPAGQPGEIVARPRRPHVMFEGYWGRPADSLKAWRNGWFHTGDIGRLDDEGFLFFVDRGKDYLRRRGENISSMEMEGAFRAHPDVADLCVHAVHAELPEDEVKITVVLKPGAALSEEALCRWSIDKLPYFAVPRFVEFRADLPRSPLGRVLKYQLRDDGITATTWDREKAGLVVPKR